MHNNIYQLSATPVSADNFIDEHSLLPDEVSSYCDYIAEYDEGSDGLSQAYNEFPFVPSMFERKNDALIYKGHKEVFSKWYERIMEKVELLNEKSIQDYSLTHGLSELLTEPFTKDIFVITEDGSLVDTMTSADFLQYCTKYLKEGDTLYLGNVLDFHW